MTLPSLAKPQDPLRQLVDTDEEAEALSELVDGVREPDPRKHAAYIWPVVRAFAEGTDIQIENDDGDWVDDPAPTFNFYEHNWRIKPLSLKTHAYVLEDVAGNERLVRVAEGLDPECPVGGRCYRVEGSERVEEVE